VQLWFSYFDRCAVSSVESIIRQMKTLSSQFENGMQEDAHEFLTFVLGSMTKSCLTGLAEKNELDKYTDSGVESSTLVQ
jgi:uncharacterized UBP type Zn finger protein